MKALLVVVRQEGTVTSVGEVRRELLLVVVKVGRHC